MTGRIDHLVITAGTLAAAVAHGEAAMGFSPGPVGHHHMMGTVNRLWSLGPEDYLEAIANDPAARAPGRPRWFGLDAGGPPRLAAWVLRVEDLDAALAEAPEGIGTPIEMERGPYRWRITVPGDGRLPYDGLFPALIEWQSTPPAPALEDHEARIVRLTLDHPTPGPLAWALSMLTSDDRVVVRAGTTGLEALIHNGQEEVVLR